MSTVPVELWKHTLAHARAPHTRANTHTHTPHYIGHSGPAPMQLQPKLRLSIIPNYRGNRAAPRQPADWLCDPECGRTHTPTLHTLQNNIYTRHTIANTFWKIIKNTPKTHSRATDEHEEPHRCTVRCLTGRLRGVQASHFIMCTEAGHMSSVQLTHTARALSAVHCACVKTESECRKEAKADMESFEGGGV